MRELIKNLEELNRRAKKGDGDAHIKKQHSMGKLAARERTNLLLGKRSFTEPDKLVTRWCTSFSVEKRKFPGGRVMTGYGMISKRPVYVFTQDFTVFGGASSEIHAKEICKVMGTAMRMGAPIIGLDDSGDVRIQEGVCSLAGYVEVFLRDSMASGVILQISAIMDPYADGAVYPSILTDFILMIENSGYAFITGPDMVKSVTQEGVSKEGLGRISTRMTKSGMAYLSAENDIEYINYVRESISYLPGNNTEEPPLVAASDLPTHLIPELSDLVPTSPDQPCNIKEVIETVVDNNSFFGLQTGFAANIVTEYTRLNGKTIGMVANQPLVPVRTLGIDASTKAAHSVRFCDAFNIPLLALVGAPGFLPGADQECGGIIRNGAKLLYAHREATVSKVTVITHRTYGGAYDVIGSKRICGGVDLAFPTTEIAMTEPDGAVNILFKKETERPQTPGERREELQSGYRERPANPHRVVELDYVDETIGPAVTRLCLMRSFEMLANKRQSNPPKKYSNIPL